MGAVSALLAAAALAAAPAPDAFRFDGPSASATVDGGPAALRVGETVHEGTGSAFVRGEDRVRGRAMTYGDAGELWVRFRSGAETYRVELDAVGFPPEAALPKEKMHRRGWWLKPESAPRRPEGSVEGGVVLGRVVGGDSGLGVRDMPARRAVVALWGIGRLYRNDELVAPRARILAQVVPGDASSREGALRTQRPRPELDVFVDQVPIDVSQAGFVHFVLNRASVSEPPAAPPVAQKREAPPRRQETREERLARRPTTEELWSSGATMIAWRDEGAPAPSGSTASGGAPALGEAMEAPGRAPANAYGSASGGNAPGQMSGGESAPSGSAASGANAPGTGQMSGGAPAPSGSAASGANVPGQMSGGAPAPSGTPAAYGAAPTPGGAYAPASAAPNGTAPAAPPPSEQLAYNLPPGTQTVIQPPPPLVAVPATPNTAPIQYETGQNGGTIGVGLIGGGASVTGAYGASAAYGGSGLAAAGAFSQGTPPPSGVFAGLNPGGAPPASTPVSPPSTPAAPPVPPNTFTALPTTPQPLNAQPPPILGATPSAPTPEQLSSTTQAAPPVPAPAPMRSTPAFQAPASPAPVAPAAPSR